MSRLVAAFAVLVGTLLPLWGSAAAAQESFKADVGDCSKYGDYSTMGRDSGLVDCMKSGVAVKNSGLRYYAYGPNIGRPVSSGPKTLQAAADKCTSTAMDRTSATNCPQLQPMATVAAGSRPGSMAPSLGVRPGSTDFLPAWRWQNVELDQDQGGLLGAVKAMPNSIALILFALANFFWQLLLNITRLGLSADFITPAAPAINAGVAQFSTLAFTFGAVILAVVFYRAVVRPALRGSISWDGIRELGGAVVLMALIMGVGNMSAGAADSFQSAKAGGKSAAEIQEQQANYEGTMPWAVRTVTGTVEDFAATLSTGWGLRDRVGDAAMGISEASDPQDRLTCTRYIDELHDQYLNYKGAGEVGSGNPTLSGMSRLWESTFYRSWTTAMFSTPAGTADLGARVMCHYAEAKNSIDPKEQAAIAVAAYDGFPNRVSRVFWENSKEEDDRRAVVAWAMCKLSGKDFEATAELQYSHGNTPQSHTADCKASDGPFGTSQDGLAKDNLDVFGNSEDLNSTTYGEQLAAARKWEHAWFGQNPSERLLNGFLALAVSLGMLWALGFMAIGLVFVQFTLVVLLLLIPLILAAIIVTKDERRDNAIGLLKLIGTSVFTKFFFALIISVLIEIAAVGQAIVDFLPGGGGLFGQVLKGLMPLAALFILRKILSRIGVGDILRPTGAVSFATKAAAMTTRNSFAAAVGSRIADKSMQMSGASKLLRKADRYAPELDKWNRAGRKARAEEIAAEKKDKLERRAEARKDRGNGPLSRVMDWANSKGWNLDRVDTFVATAAKGAAAGVGAIGVGGAVLAGGAPALIAAGAIGGNKGRNMLRNWQNQRRARSETQFGEARELNSTPGVDAIAADADLRSYTRARERAYRAGQSLEQFDQERVLNAYQGSIEAQYGSGFESFTDEAEAFATREAYAQAHGYNASDVLVGMDGMMMPMPVSSDKRRELSIDQLSHWAHWLDDSDKSPRENEDTEAYMNRLFATGVARGLVTSDGRAVDIWSKLGLDMADTNDRRRVESWLRGDRNDAVLENTVFQSRNSSAEAAMIKTVLQKRGLSPEVQRRRDTASAEMVSSTIQTIRKDISSRMSGSDDLRVQIGELAHKLDQARANADHAAARSLAEQLRGEVDTLSRETFDLVQDMVTSQASLLLGTGQLQGIEQIERHLADELNRQMDHFRSTDEALVGVLAGRNDVAGLLTQLENLRNHVRSLGAGLVTEADRAHRYVTELHRQGLIEGGRIGDATRTSAPIRALVERIGSHSFPLTAGQKGGN